MATSSPNLALLIDADNVSSKVIVGLLAEIANYGTASVRRIYGDWTSPNLGSWKECLLDHSITPIQQFAYTKGKNATDGAMIIDAMDLLYTGRFSGFCLVSSDSDFTRLASRIREQGLTVYGFGERKTPKPLISACDKFTYFDVLAGVEPDDPAPPTLRASAPLIRKETTTRQFDAEALMTLAKAVANCSSESDGWSNLAQVGAYLSKISPDLNARNYGYTRLKDFVEATGMVDLRFKTIGDKPPIAWVRLKQSLV